MRLKLREVIGERIYAEIGVASGKSDWSSWSFVGIICEIVSAVVRVKLNYQIRINDSKRIELR